MRVPRHYKLLVHIEGVKFSRHLMLDRLVLDVARAQEEAVSTRCPEQINELSTPDETRPEKHENHSED